MSVCVCVSEKAHVVMLFLKIVTHTNLVCLIAYSSQAHALSCVRLISRESSWRAELLHRPAVVSALAVILRSMTEAHVRYDVMCV